MERIRLAPIVIPLLKMVQAQNRRLRIVIFDAFLKSNIPSSYTEKKVVFFPVAGPFTR